MPERILIYEHDASIRDLLSHWLTKRQFNICLAGTPEEAVAYVARADEPFAIFLIDVCPASHLADVDLLAALRAEPRHGRTPAIACTVYSGWEIRDLTEEAGFDDVLEKPFALREILNAIGRATQRRPGPARLVGLS